MRAVSVISHRLVSIVFLLVPSLRLLLLVWDSLLLPQCFLVCLSSRRHLSIHYYIGIELCDMLRKTYQQEELPADDETEQASRLLEQSLPPSINSSTAEESPAMETTDAIQTVLKRKHSSGMDAISDGIPRQVDELDKALHEILRTVLAEATARDVIHEVYKPKLEPIDVKELLCSRGLVDWERFPFEIKGENIPFMLLDAQLLLYIHRNAVSNGMCGDNGSIVLD